MAGPVCSRTSKNSRVVLDLHGGGSTINHPPSPPQVATSNEPPHGGSRFFPMEHDHLADTGGVNSFTDHGINVGGVITGVTSSKLSPVDSDLHNI